MLKPQHVTAALRKAGFRAASDRWDIPGYNARRTRGRAVAVFTHGIRCSACAVAYSESLEEALTDAGFKVTRPYPAPDALCVSG